MTFLEAITIGLGFALGFYAAVIVAMMLGGLAGLIYIMVKGDDEVDHAVEDNTPEYDMETLNIPAYLRRTEAKQLDLPL
jgi:hypothetical protein